jgi:hypothetical protein
MSLNLYILKISSLLPVPLTMVIGAFALTAARVHLAVLERQTLNRYFQTSELTKEIMIRKNMREADVSRLAPAEGQGLLPDVSMERLLSPSCILISLT